MRLKQYYNNKIKKIENIDALTPYIIGDYMSHYEMNAADLEFMHSLGYTADDFLETDCTEEEFYNNNDLYLLIDYFYDVYGFLFTSKIRNYTKEDLKDKLKMLNNCTKALTHIIENYTD